MVFGFRRRIGGDCGGPGFGRPTDNTKNRRDKQQKDFTFFKEKIAAKEQWSDEKLYAGVHYR